MLRIPHSIRTLLSRMSSALHPVERVTLRTDVPKTVYKWWLMNEEMEEYKRRFLALWKSKNIDAVICPVLPYTAFPRGEESSCMAGITYTSIYNIVGLPTGTVPASKVEKRDLDKLHSEYPHGNQAEKYMHKVCDNSLGLPVGVQCVALPFQEEVALRVMRELEEGLAA
ncbi:fatty-acid amide hydrolase 1-like [Elysia marginata]|uniref:Fatty-acid amide hydrolase 1-like n=1 Tax=Elysia marginata TaxID=1093978 RepID=A0AAV4JTW6_9GAST|nr:fatty-acid amide hydrolase 1-like [Elysia marginata]